MRQSETRLAAIGLGSNLDGPAMQVRRAFDELAQLAHTRLQARSPLYRSVAIGPDGEFVSQPDFCNAVALLETGLSARELLGALRWLEASHGRSRGSKWAARSLDLDLLVYADQVIAEPDLAVPHPHMADRNFVMHPLRDLAPDLEVPGLGKVRELADRLGTRGLQPWRD